MPPRTHDALPIYSVVSAGDVDNRISHLSIAKDGPRSIQPTKILEAIPYLCQDKHYDYISDIISTNTEPTQEDSIKRRHPSKHHMKLGVVDPIIGLNVPSGNSPINSEIVEYTPISNMNPLVPQHSDRDEGAFSKSYEWDKLIADKKSIMELILNRCDEATREEITLGQSPEYDVMAGGFLKFIKRLRKVCAHSKGKDVFFGSSISKFTKHHIRPATRKKNYPPHIRTMIVFGITRTHVKYL